MRCVNVSSLATLAIAALIFTAACPVDAHVQQLSSSLLLGSIGENADDLLKKPSALRRRAEGDEDHADEDHEDHKDEDHDDEDHESKPWGQVIGFSFVVNLATLSGVLLLAFPAIRKDLTNRNAVGNKCLNIWVPAFAAGALFATVVFLILPETLPLIDAGLGASAHDDHDDHGDEDHGNEGHDRLRFLAEEDHGEDHDEHVEFSVGAMWRFGAALMGGYMLPLLFAVLFPIHSHSIPTVEAVEEEKFAEDNVEAAEAAAGDHKQINYPLVLSLFFGDFFHNFSDGVIIGTAFLGCDNRMAYTIVGVTLYHELAQEIADFFLYTRHGGLTVIQALIVNFVSGLSVLFGGITILASGVGELENGILLAASCGLYTYIATTECMPAANAACKNPTDRVYSMLAFTLGVVPIGLTLINHSHCGHDDHDH
mmetsp:Transcript_3287/g.3832  ORF Transcript_3287/g.3832 Transcript_3287/m.3832 type:complete len:426 (-) Transcript_3287:180-1457(-)